MNLAIRHSAILVILLTVTVIASLEIQPAKATSNASSVTLTITTLPHTPRFPVALRNGSLFEVNDTDQSGNATFNVSPGDYQLASGYPCPRSNLVVNSSSEACFLMWGDGNSSLVRDVRLTTNATMLILLQYSGKVDISFTDNSGTKVDDSLVDVALIQGGDGVPHLTYSYKGLWFPENRFQRTSSGIIRWRILTFNYTILAVNVTGENVIQSGLYHYSPRNAAWHIKLLLYPFTVTVSDLFFGQSVEATVVVTDFTGGFEVGRASTQDGVASFIIFPRGNYLVRTSGSGIGIPSAVIITGPMAVQAKIFSIADALSLGGLGLVFGAIILWRQRRRSRMQLSIERKFTSAVLP